MQGINDVADQSEGVGGQLAEVGGGKVGEALNHLSNEVDTLVVLEGDLDSFTLKSQKEKVRFIHELHCCYLLLTYVVEVAHIDGVTDSALHVDDILNGHIFEVLNLHVLGAEGEVNAVHVADMGSITGLETLKMHC